MPLKLAAPRQPNASRCKAADGEAQQQGGYPDPELDSAALPNNFCIIESPNEAVKDFADMQLSDIRANVESRRTKIFLLMEEVRRLRIQERLKRPEGADDESYEAFVYEKFPSVLPFAPPLTSETIKKYYLLFGTVMFAIIMFGGLVAPILEVKLGMGGQSYADFIKFMHLPQQLSEVDPIVASFCGGAVGVLTALLIVEENNVTRQAKARCAYCEGTGYIACGNCFSSGQRVDANGEGCRCANCSGTGKVACTACLCTGKMLATEHDPRIDPFL